MWLWHNLSGTELKGERMDRLWSQTGEAACPNPLWTSSGDEVSRILNELNRSGSSCMSVAGLAVSCSRLVQD